MKLNLTILLFLIVALGFSQNDSKDEKYIFSKDLMIIDVNYLGIISNNCEIRPTSTDVNTDLMFTIAGKDKHTLALGIGLNIQNYQTNYYINDSLGITSLYNIDKRYKYRRNKFGLVFINIPVEYRFKSIPDLRKRSVKIFIGCKIGYNFQSFHKYIGNDYRFTNTSKYVKFKEYRLANLSKLTYSAHIRIGFGKIALNFQYYFVPVFNKNKGPEITHYSVGLTFIPL